MGGGYGKIYLKVGIGMHYFRKSQVHSSALVDPNLILGR